MQHVCCLYYWINKSTISRRRRKFKESCNWCWYWRWWQLCHMLWLFCKVSNAVAPRWTWLIEPWLKLARQLDASKTSGSTLLDKKQTLAFYIYQISQTEVNSSMNMPDCSTTWWCSSQGQCCHDEMLRSCLACLFDFCHWVSCFDE